MVSGVGMKWEYKFTTRLSDGTVFSTYADELHLKTMRRNRRCGFRRHYIDGDVYGGTDADFVYGTAVSYCLEDSEGNMVDMWVAGWD